MLPDTLLRDVDQLAEAYAKAQTCKALVRLSAAEAERANLQARADYWDAQVEHLRACLADAVRAALPATLAAVPDPHTPVGNPTPYEVELRGSLDTRTVTLRYPAAQAVAVGTAMIACAAFATQRAGGTLAAVVPPIPPLPLTRVA